MKRLFARYLRENWPFFYKWIPIRRPVLVDTGAFKLYLRLDDAAVGLGIWLTRRYEPHVSKAIRAILRPDMIFVDVGANIGYHSLLAASIVGPGGEVLSFEPNPENTALITNSALENRFGNIRVIAAAVANKPGEIGYFSRPGSSNGVVGPLEAFDNRVPAVTLDDALDAYAVIDAVKMDVEGAEGLVLEGMSAIIARCRPNIIFEFNPDMLRRRSQIEPEDMLNRLRSIGYHLYILSSAENALEKPAEDREIYAILGSRTSDHLDILAIPTSL